MAEAAKPTMGPGGEPWLLKPWKTIHLGGPVNTSDWNKLLKDKGVATNVWTNDILAKLNFGSCKRKEVEIYRVPLVRLGLRYSATYSDVMAAAMKQHFRYVPPEIVAQLRIQYMDQPENEFLYLGTRSRPFTGCNRAFFGVVHDYLGKRITYHDVQSTYLKKESEIILCHWQDAHGKL